MQLLVFMAYYSLPNSIYSDMFVGILQSRISRVIVDSRFCCTVMFRGRETHFSSNRRDVHNVAMSNL